MIKKRENKFHTQKCGGGSKLLDPIALILKLYAANIMKVYFKNEKKPTCIEIFIHGLKYINIKL
jgi:hypothetical protein